jgi:hypothetical protein
VGFSLKPLLKNEWVEIGDPAPSHRRTRGGTRGPGRWPLSSPRRRRRWPAGQALQGQSVPGYDRHRPTDGLRFQAMRSRQASCRGGVLARRRLPTTSPSRRRMPEPNTNGSRVHEFPTAKLRRGCPDVSPRPDAARMIEDYYNFPMGSGFEQSVNHARRPPWWPQIGAGARARFGCDQKWRIA